MLKLIAIVRRIGIEKSRQPIDAAVKCFLPFERQRHVDAELQRNRSVLKDGNEHCKDRTLIVTVRLVISILVKRIQSFAIVCDRTEGIVFSRSDKLSYFVAFTKTVRHDPRSQPGKRLKITCSTYDRRKKQE